MTPAPLRDLVAGRWRDAEVELALVRENPLTGEALGPALATSPARVEEALAAADAVQDAWAATTPEERASALEAVAAALEPRVAEIAALESFATGVPIRQTLPLGMIITGSFLLAAGQLREGWLTRGLRREDGRETEVLLLPWGPALCLTPWNAPAPMGAHKVANALAAGCPAILKASEFVPYGSQLMAEVIDGALRAAGVPDGVFQFVQGDASVGGRLTLDPRIRAVSFTGGAKGGAAVAAACGAGVKPVQLELGGNNPLIILPGTDTATAARAAVDLLTTLNGQWCRALGRLIVPADDHDAIVSAVLDRLATLKPGDPLDEATDFGPLVHSAHRGTVEAQRAALGGTVHTALKVAEEGNFLSPALVTGVPADQAVEEIFGPVATVHAYGTVEEALALANGTSYGLEAYVFGPDEEAALAVARKVRAGEVKVNGSSIMSLHLFAPRPAWGRSGLGEEGTAETLRFFTNPRVVGAEGGFALHSREA
ncbi:phenylacetaldehyde dehydrogenase [Actinocorallia herbida]|uniref:Phenylacetaldehyde dehydrogenase n=1 Tax=Actinocorallia herbida TaxID=58109 RepID=A0A3N1D4Y7_9ACTN|nr:aldehyde dehydrogenase family protein [Actinocorallia herbida]ROO88526.1 phenylacetaldehyde dehydrogenase [Actinocorallia herbida]